MLLKLATAAGLRLRVWRGGGEGGSLSAARALFARARAVVGVHGAGLANVVMCPRGTALVEVTLPEKKYWRYFRDAAVSLGLAYAAVPLDPPAEGLFNSAVTVPVEALRDAVERALWLGG
jgi:hypothetical protein